MPDKASNEVTMGIGDGESILVTPDGGVRKAVTKAGTGSQPHLHATCIVHYVGRLKDSGEVFMDTEQEGCPARLVAGRDSVLQGAGLNLAVATMQRGEKARISVQPKYGYGERGNFSFPAVPPNADLEYDVELIGFEDSIKADNRDRTDMLYEERLEAAERRRLEGNKLFQEGNPLDAMAKYTMALSYMDQDFMFQLQGAHETKANAVRIPVLLNLAACQIKQTDFKGAVSSANQALSVEPKNVKGLYRRGRAYRLSGNLNAALHDLQQACMLTPSDAVLATELQAIRKAIKDEQRSTDDLFRGRFPPTSKHRPATPGQFWRWIVDRIVTFLTWLGIGLRQERS